MPTPTTLNDTTASLTPRGRLAVQLFGIRDMIRPLGPADRDWGMRTVTFADPAGYIWEIAQAVPVAG